MVLHRPVELAPLLGMWPYLEVPTFGSTKVDQTVSGSLQLAVKL
jgi:hypothetical protein